MAGSFLDEVDDGGYEHLDSKAAQAKRSTERWSAFSTAVANFNIQYNFQVITIVLAFMDNGPKVPDTSVGVWRPPAALTESCAQSLS